MRKKLIQKQEISLHMRMHSYEPPHSNPAKGGGLRKSPPPLMGGGKGEGDYVNLFNSFAIIFLFSISICLFWFGIGNADHLDDGSSASDIQKIKAIPIPADRMVQPFHPFTISGDRFCVIQYDNGSPQWYFPYFDTGWGFAVYMDPGDCEGQNSYPFKITDVHLHLCDFQGAVWPVEIQVNIKQLEEDTTLCPDLGKPGTLLYQQTFTIPIDSSYDSLGEPMILSLDSLITPNFTRCLDTVFFLEIIFTGETSMPFPSLMMTDTLDSAETCYDWFLFEGSYHEWYEAWELPTPGKPIIRAAGYTHSLDCYPCWYWKPDNPTAPSGMPDFDQYQFDDSSALDVPTAVANCLWWFDEVPEDTNSPDLIRLLSNYLSTDPDSGTIVDSIESGLDSCFNDYGLSLYEHTYYQPRFREMVDSLRKSQNIVLILGFWQFYENSWHRFGGHAVTLTGVCPESLWVGLSDPAVDGAEFGWQGRFFPLGHPPHPDDDTLHNNPLYVSHDIYVSDTLFVDYGDSVDTLWVIKDFYHADTLLFRRFDGQNFQPGQTQYYYEPSESVHTVVEYAIMICSKSTAVEEEEEVITPEDFQLFQNHPNPFNNETTIKYTLFKSCHVSLVIYNVLGQKVRTLVMEYQRAGVKTVSWDGKNEKGKDLSSGIYFYQLSAGSIGKVGEITQTKRMVLLK